MTEYRETILLVDDEVSDRASMKEDLQRQGYAVFPTTDYLSAFALFQEHREKINMLVSDIALPGMNGCDLAKALLALKPELKVLFVSGHVGAEICKFYGFPVTDVHFLQKPFRSQDFADRVRYILDHSEPLPLVSAA